MEKETKEKMEKILGDILKESDLNKITEFEARELATERLGIDLSENPYKTILRYLVKLFRIEEEKARKLSKELDEYKEDLDMKKKLEELDKEDLDIMKKKSWKRLVGFNIIRPGPGMMQTICDDRRSPCCALVRLYAKYGLHRYNMLQGTNLQLICVRKYNKILNLYQKKKKNNKTKYFAANTYYITLVAMDPATTKLLTFLAEVAESSSGKLILMCCIARPLGANTDDDGTSDISLSGLCRVPKFPPEDLFEIDKVKESEVEHNDWIRLYLELAVSRTRRGNRDNLDFSNLKIEKVVIETTNEEKMEEEAPNEEGSLNAINAIIYIRYKDFCEARVGEEVDRIAIVRRTFNQNMGCFILKSRVKALKSRVKARN